MSILHESWTNPPRVFPSERCFNLVLNIHRFWELFFLSNNSLFRFKISPSLGTPFLGVLVHFTHFWAQSLYQPKIGILHFEWQGPRVLPSCAHGRDGGTQGDFVQVTIFTQQQGYLPSLQMSKMESCSFHHEHGVVSIWYNIKRITKYVNQKMTKTCGYIHTSISITTSTSMSLSIYLPTYLSIYLTIFWKIYLFA